MRINKCRRKSRALHVDDFMSVAGTPTHDNAITNR